METKPPPSEVAACQQQFERSLFEATQSFTQPVRRWVLAHSGGLDSQVLLHLAASQTRYRPLHVLHINHQLQASAQDWAGFSAAQAERFGVEYSAIEVIPESSSEKAARDARYQAFEQFLQPGDCLLLAQHADDQAETVLFRLLRGSGPNGLSGMPVARALGQGCLLRPLLNLTKSQLQAYATHFQLTWVDDPSNLNDRYSRNFLRHSIMPALAQRWPGLSHRLSEVATRCRQEHQLLNAYLDRDLKTLVVDNQLRLPLLLTKPDVQQSMLLRRWLEVATGALLNEVQLQVIRSGLINAECDAQPLFQKQGLTLRRYRGCLYLNNTLSLAAVETLPSLTCGTHDLGDGRLTITADSAGLRTLKGVKLRRRQGGERCRPAGRSNSMTLKNLFQEAGVPPWLRASWPLLYAGDQLVAVPGICVAEGWYVDSKGFCLNWHSFALSEQG
ncbi:tRNA lysidine(34) synthetase TilS [Neptuniibacter sp. CAU 1671]|uniref:tRNA lysidine(34) synthetase TilS n=1 Tax=Neptuniibacter sp. CAU 1671 TaxID=3032593 RepID=UPI0023DC0527|nr:tRNA lysidine(34) synthetase TilS [Neptuniibacter sp. CAU 1671]MDF2181780.1 tRNA lysidine(34) synthetase TilS [Neptuniibacter sp. CAU 1671]